MSYVKLAKSSLKFINLCHSPNGDAVPNRTAILGVRIKKEDTKAGSAPDIAPAPSSLPREKLLVKGV